MTAAVTLDAVAWMSPLDSTVTVSAAAAAVGESSAGLQEGDVMTLENGAEGAAGTFGKRWRHCAGRNRWRRAADFGAGKRELCGGCFRCADERYGRKGRLHEHGVRESARS